MVGRGVGSVLHWWADPAKDFGNKLGRGIDFLWRRVQSGLVASS